MRRASAPSETTFIDPHPASSRMKAIAGARLPTVTRLAASPHIAARGAPVAAVLADHGVVAALRAAPALHHFGVAVGRRLEDPHLAMRHAVLVEDAQHRVAVQDEACDVRYGGRTG